MHTDHWVRGTVFGKFPVVDNDDSDDDNAPISKTGESVSYHDRALGSSSSAPSSTDREWQRPIVTYRLPLNRHIPRKTEPCRNVLVSWVTRYEGKEVARYRCSIVWVTIIMSKVYQPVSTTPSIRCRVLHHAPERNVTLHHTIRKSVESLDVPTLDMQ
jgi:hypothetical protein